MAKLTSTSYALLGLLYRRPWSAYELAKYMQSSAIRVVWPRAESGIYKEPKKLLEQGLATVRHEQANGRLRAVYDITESGREALQQWLAQPSQGPSIEYESMLKFLLLTAADKYQLLEKIGEMAQEAGAQYDAVNVVMREVVAKGFTVKGKGVQSVVANIFTQELLRALSDWTALAHKFVADIPDGLNEEEMEEWALNQYRELLERGPQSLNSIKGEK